MGSIEDWNAMRTAKAAEEVAAHARAEELRRQGVIGPTDGVAEARAHDQQMRAQNQSGGASVVLILVVLGGIALFVWICVALISTALS